MANLTDVYAAVGMMCGAWMIAACAGSASSTTPSRGGALHGAATDVGLRFTLPPGYSLQSSVEEEIPSLIPGAPPSHERFRGYADASGGGIYLIHLEGVTVRDRGPAAYVETWTIEAQGQPIRVGQTRMFLGRDQAVLTAHFAHPDPEVGRYLIYATSLERTAFEQLLTSIRFESVP